MDKNTIIPILNGDDMRNLLLDDYIPSELQWLETMHRVFTAKVNYLEKLAIQASREKRHRATLRLEGEIKAYKHMNEYFADRIKSLKK